ncbi:hypothetical protein Btru_074534 [Bulinus truncatus]|nr:hypothetical protein Btru_074534 [Bulinus truncatus]
MPGESKYGVHNDQQYTICSCECDRRLRICLQEVGTITSRAVGSLFFNVVGIKCFKTRPLRVSGFTVGRVADLMSPDAYDPGAKVHSFDEVLAGNVSVVGWLGSLFGGK